MNLSKTKERAVLRDLGNGLILRQATTADIEVLAAFNADILRDPGTEPDERVATLTRDLMSGTHPTFKVSDFTVVEDTRTGRIVSSLNLISQIWSYGGIKFGVGRPELVGTHPDYRRRGLVRAQFEVIHGWSAERGEKVQAITGIPWYYRQFGYEMGLELGGGRIGYQPQVPTLKDGQAEPYRVRPATEADIPFISQVYHHGMKRYLVAGAYRNEALWRYELYGRSENSDGQMDVRVVETATGEPAGFLTHKPNLRRSTFGVNMYELKPGISWLAATPSVIRYLWATGEVYATHDQKETMGAFAFWLGTEHPVYQVLPEGLPHVRIPYAWYIRVPDLPDFLRHVAPVLEQRLAELVAVGHTGQLKISFYRSGLRLVFDNGRLTMAEPWTPTHDERGDAGFPDLTFLQLLFGYRTLSELRYAFADCWVQNDEAGALLSALFPKQVSRVWPIM